MAILFLSQEDPEDAWGAALARELPGETLRLNTPPAEDSDVEFAIVWRPPRGRLTDIPSLKAIFSLGAGVDHVLADPDLPEGVPVIRLIDPDLTAQMTEYVVMNALWHHRRMDSYAAQQREARWRQLDQPLAQTRRVGLMGLGVLGQAAAEALARFGFPLAAWTRGSRGWAVGELFSGPHELGPFLGRTDILVCLLPLTDETRGILDARALARLPAGAALINAARGPLVVEADLIEALDSGRLSGATLDVFAREPLPADHPFWTHPRIRITPHVAAITFATSGAREIAANIRRFRAGEPMIGVVDRTRGY